LAGALKGIISASRTDKENNVGLLMSMVVILSVELDHNLITASFIRQAIRPAPQPFVSHARRALRQDFGVWGFING
jgi:hypothetical protein